MRWLQLAPDQIIARIKAGPTCPRVPTLTGSILLGAAGFTMVSVAGFAPWALAGRVLYHTIGELGMYAACALVFLGLSGLFLHRLIIGPGSLVRFYLLFTPSFGAYAVVWTIAWICLRGHLGGAVGLLLGTLAMAWIFVRAFDTPNLLIRVTAALFLLNAAGYFVGGWVEPAIIKGSWLAIPGVEMSRSLRASLAMLSWGVCYGLGFGAGLGLAFYWCQEKARSLLPKESAGKPELAC